MYSLHLADLTNRSQFDDVNAWGHKCFGAAVMSSPVWKCYDVSRKQLKILFVVYILHDDMMNGWFIFTADSVTLELICASLHTSVARYGSTGTRADHGHSVNACVYTSHAAACF